jgi:hypothetical protein
MDKFESSLDLFLLSIFIPCGKQHFREIPTPDFVRTLRPYPILNSMLDSYKIRRGYFAEMLFPTWLLSTFSCHIRPPESFLSNEDFGRSSQRITVRCAPMFPEQSATAKTEAKSLAGAPLRRACSRRIDYFRCRTGCTPSFDRRGSLHVRASHPVSNDARSFR